MICEKRSADKNEEWLTFCPELKFTQNFDLHKTYLFFTHNDMKQFANAKCALMYPLQK